jgi:hypothetical protein
MKRRKACRQHIKDIKRELLGWEAHLHHARHIGHAQYEAQCFQWINLLKGEIDGIKWVMFGDEPEDNVRILK